MAVGNGKESGDRSPHSRARRVLVAFEYGTLNGGERSMLAVFDALRRQVAGGDDTDGAIALVAAAPGSGPLAEALAARGIEHRPLELRDATGRRVPRETAGERLVEIVRRVEPDLVHANSLSMGRLTGAITEHTPPPTVAHLRDILRLSRGAVADLNRNRALVAVSQATRAFHVEQGLDAERMHVIYNGVDCEEFQPRPPTGSLRRELGLPAGAFLIGTIGQIGLRKGHDVLAEAAALAAPRLPHAHYVLVGERYSSKRESIEFEQSIVRRFEQAGLGDRLHRLGFRDDVPRLMNELDLLAHPAHQEPLGRVLLEAAAAGLPIVATNVGGTPEILTDGESARLVRAGGAAALAEAIVTLGGDAGLRRRFSECARTCVAQTFEVRSAADHLAGLWREICVRPWGHRGWSCETPEHRAGASLRSSPGHPPD